MHAKRAFRLALLAALFALGLESARAGGSTEILVCYPGKPGSTSAAKDVMESLAGYLGDQAKLEKGALSAIYFNEEKPALARFDESKPGYGILSLGLYLKWKKDGKKIVPLAISEKGEEHATTERFHVLVPKESALAKLGDLKGKVVASSYLEDPRFATKIVFAGALDAQADIALVTTRLLTMAIQKCLLGGAALADGKKLEAVVVDDAQLKGMQGMAAMAKLRRVWSSEPLPTPPFVAFGDAATTDLGKKLGGILAGMSKDPAGKTVIESLQETSGFRPVPDGAYAAVENAY